MCDKFSLPSIGDNPPNNVDNTSDNDSATPDGHFCGENAPNQDTDLGVEVEPVLPLRELQEMGGVTAQKGQNEEADHLFVNGERCFLSFDIEHGGEYCCIVQLFDYNPHESVLHSYTLLGIGSCTSCLLCDCL